MTDDDMKAARDYVEYRTLAKGPLDRNALVHLQALLAEVERLRGERDALLAVVRAVAELQPTSVGGFDALRVGTLHPRFALAQLPSTASALVAAHDAAPHD